MLGGRPYEPTQPIWRWADAHPHTHSTPNTVAQPDQLLEYATGRALYLHPRMYVRHDYEMSTRSLYGRVLVARRLLACPVSYTSHAPNVQLRAGSKAQSRFLALPPSQSACSFAPRRCVATGRQHGNPRATASVGYSSSSTVVCPWRALTPR